MLAVLRSPRKRKRLAYVAVALAAAGAASGYGVTHSDTARHLPDRFEAGHVSVVRHQRAVPFSEADRRRVEAVLQVFVDHAVARRDPEVAYDLVTPTIRGASTRADWARGDVPVYPYPAARQKVQIAWLWASYRNDVDFDVVLLPRKRALIGPMAVGVEMKATGTGASRRWRVDSFTPRQFYGR